MEVLSDSTEAYDSPLETLCERGEKFEKYRRNPNLIDYVLVSSDEVSCYAFKPGIPKAEALTWLGWLY